MTCDEVSELLAAYALDALTPEEHAAVREHLETCSLHTELASLRAAADALAGTADPLTPPAALRARVLSLAAGAPLADLTLPAPGGARTPMAPMRHTPWALAAALAAFAFVLGIWAGQQGQPSSNLVRREAAAAAGSSHGRVVYVPEQQLLAFEVSGLAPAPAGRDYQLWIVRGSAPVSLGTFATTVSGRGTVATQTGLAAGEALAVTLEPLGGSPAPTTTPFLVIKYD